MRNGRSGRAGRSRRNGESKETAGGKAMLSLVCRSGLPRWLGTLVCRACLPCWSAVLVCRACLCWVLDSSVIVFGFYIKESTTNLLTKNLKIRQN